MTSPASHGSSRLGQPGQPAARRDQRPGDVIAWAARHLAVPDDRPSADKQQRHRWLRAEHERSHRAGDVGRPETVQPLPPRADDPQQPA